MTDTFAREKNASLESLVAQVADEFQERQRRGERPDVEEYAARHPHAAAVLRKVLASLQLLILVPSSGQAGREDSAAGPAPGTLGDFRLVREVGRGGMGVVYEAVQESLGRVVALKVRHAAGPPDPVQRERFRREARAAARLHHTNIVPVFGAGEQDGVQYYVMQFIQGQSLDVVLQEVRRRRGETPVPAPTPHSDQATQPYTAAAPAADTVVAHEEATVRVLAGRPELGAPSETAYYHGVARVGLQVAEALAYAHGRGVVHRDVKPSNLLLDTAGTVWVADFGLAKADGVGRLSGPEDVVGTLRYLPPERLRGVSEPAGDVYSLGATLYELLTTRPAFAESDRARLLERLARDEPPPPRRLDARIPRDLETVVLKAMAKDPNDRYADAPALADDLRRFLADRPIRARRLTALGQAWRWCRRNPAVAGLLLALALALTGGLAGVTWLWRAAEGGQADARRGRAEAEQSFRLAREAVDRYLARVSQSKLFDVDGMQPLRRELLQDALEFYREFLRQRGADPAVERELAQAQHKVGIITLQIGPRADALAAFEDAHQRLGALTRKHPDDTALREHLARACNSLASVRQNLGRKAEALAAYDQGRTLLQELLAERPAGPVLRRDLGAVQMNRATLLRELDRPDDAFDAYRQCLALFQGLVDEFPDDADYRSGLGLTYTNLGYLNYRLGLHDEALAAYRRALGLHEGRPGPQDEQGVARAQQKLGQLFRATGRAAEAQAAYEQAAALLEKFAAKDPHVVGRQSRLAEVRFALGTLHGKAGRHAEALAAYRQARALYQALAEKLPGERDYQRGLAEAAAHVGGAYLFARAGTPAEALEAYLQARHAWGGLAEKHPGVAEYRREAAAAAANTAALLAREGRKGEALDPLRQARTTYERMLEQNPGDARARRELAGCLHSTGSLLADLGRPAEALPALRRARDLREQEPGVRDAPADSALAKTLHTLGSALHGLSRRDEATAALREAAARQRAALDRDPESAEYRRLLGQHYRRLARLEREAGRPTQAAAAARARQELWPHDPRELFDAACELARCVPLVESDAEAERRRYGDQAMDALRRAVREGYKDLGRLLQEPDLDPLRGRADFRELLKSLEAVGPESRLQGRASEPGA